MENTPAGKETLADIRRTDAFRNQISIEQSARMRSLTPAERRSARSEGAVVVGFTGFVALLTDLHRKSRDTHRRPANISWSPRAHGWIFH